MKKIALVFNFLLAVSLLADLSYGSSDNDHLNPVATGLEPRYRQMLADCLFNTPGNFARIVRLPSAASDGESAISIYSQNTDEADVKITCTKAQANIWYAASQLNRDLMRRPTVNVSRKDAPFPRSLAERISGRLRRAIGQAAPLAPTSRIAVDGTAILFSTAAGRDQVAGILDQVAEGKLSYALRQLENLLRRYCEATPGVRKKLEKEIDIQSRDI